MHGSDLVHTCTECTLFMLALDLGLLVSQVFDSNLVTQYRRRFRIVKEVGNVSAGRLSRLQA